MKENKISLWIYILHTIDLKLLAKNFEFLRFILQRLHIQINKNQFYQQFLHRVIFFIDSLRIPSNYITVANNALF